MVTVEVVTPKLDSNSPQDDWDVVARLTVDGGSWHVDGDGSVFDYTMPVIGITTHRRVSFRRNPEEWARSLPGSYRSPYLLARVVSDDAGVHGSPFWSPEEADRDERFSNGSRLEGLASGLVDAYIAALRLLSRRRGPAAGATASPEEETTVARR
jgi:hypothetical protein